MVLALVASTFAMACTATAYGQEMPRVLLIEQERLVKAKTPGEGTIDVESDADFGPWLGTAFVHDGGGCMEWFARAVQSSTSTNDSLFVEGEVETIGGPVIAQNEYRLVFEVTRDTEFQLTGLMTIQFFGAGGDTSGKSDVDVVVSAQDGRQLYAEGLLRSAYDHVSPGDRCLAVRGDLTPGVYVVEISAQIDAWIISAAYADFSIKVGFGEPFGGLPLGIEFSDPRDGAIDARADRSPDDGATLGYDRVVRLTFSNAVWDEVTLGAIGPDSFELVDSAGAAPSVMSINPVKCLASPSGEPLPNSANSYDVVFDRPITPGAWTTLIANVVDSVSGLPIEGDPMDRVELGFLPGDVNGDGTSAPSDVLVLIDHLNGVASQALEDWQCNIDHLGKCKPADILRLIDLLNGVNTSQRWLNATLPPRP
jgi:hypothetical protein